MGQNKTTGWRDFNWRISGLQSEVIYGPGEEQECDKDRVVVVSECVESCKPTLRQRPLLILSKAEVKSTVTKWIQCPVGGWVMPRSPTNHWLLLAARTSDEKINATVQAGTSHWGSCSREPSPMASWDVKFSLYVGGCFFFWSVQCSTLLTLMIKSVHVFSGNKFKTIYTSLSWLKMQRNEG